MFNFEHITKINYVKTVKSVAIKNNIAYMYLTFMRAIVMMNLDDSRYIFDLFPTFCE